MKRFFLLILLALACAAASAQVTTSSISGNVTDRNGAPLVGATVIAIHTPSGTQYGAAVDNKGNYRIYNVRPGGPYTLRFQMIGYQTVENTGIQLALAENSIRNATLEEDAIGMEAVVVSADGKGSSMNSDRAGAVINVSREAIELMPTVSRSMNDVMRLSPQSNTTSNGFAVGGGNYRQSYVTVDGAAFNNAFGIGGNLPAGGTPISLDALEQVSVAVTPFDVRQSGFTGGAINAVTRSGDNELRGSAYTYLTNNNLKGIHVGDYDLTRSKASEYTYGFTLGGPIVRDKLFFFVNGEYQDNVTAGPTRLARPDENTEYGSGTDYNRPLASDMERIRDFVRRNFGYDTGDYANYDINTPAYKIMARMDWNINANNTLNLRVSHTHYKYSSGPSSSTSPLSAGTIYPGHGSSGGRTSNYGLYFENSRYYQRQDFTSVAVEWNARLFEGRGNNALRFTYSYQNEPRTYDGGLFPTVDILKDGDVYASLGTEVFTEGNLRRVSTIVVTDEFNYRAGINNILAGVQFEHNRATNGYMQAGAGYYVYASMDDFFNNATPSAFGITHSNNSDGSQFLAQMDYQQFSAYVQDELDLHRNFKLTAGLRFEVPIYPSLDGNFNEKLHARDFGGVHYSTAQVPDTRLTVSPRLGFNWDITGERRFVLRGGTGYFVGRLPFVWLVSAVGNSGVGQTTYYYDRYEAGVKAPGFSTNVNDILSDIDFKPEVSEPGSPTIIDKELKMPAVWKSSLAFDAKLPGGVDLTVEGIYSRDFHPAVVDNRGYKPWDGESYTEYAPGDRRPVVNQMYSDATWANKYQNIYYIRNAGNGAYYYSISAQLRKSFAFGLNLAVAYTHSGGKSYGDGIGDQVSSAYKTNTYSVGANNDHELGYGTYIAPDRVIASIGFRKEYGKHFGTSVALFYDGGQLGYDGGYSYSRYSYTFSSNIVGDYGANNLLYIPATREELDAWNFGDISSNGTVTYSAEQQKDDFWAFINQDKYLKTRKGKYTERGGALMPWHHRVDFKFAQDFFIKTRDGKRNTLTFGVDIINVANLLNKDWGLYKQVVNSGLLKYNKGVYNFQQASGRRVTSTFQNYTSFNSTFSVQFSLRYRFN